MPALVRVRPGEEQATHRGEQSSGDVHTAHTVRPEPEYGHVWSGRVELRQTTITNININKE